MSEFDRNLLYHAVATTAMAIPIATHNLACDRRPARECCSPAHRLNNPRTDRVTEVGTIDFRQRRSHGVKIEEIAIDDLGAALLQFS